MQLFVQLSDVRDGREQCIYGDLAIDLVICSNFVIKECHVACICFCIRECMYVFIFCRLK